MDRVVKGQGKNGVTEGRTAQLDSCLLPPSTERCAGFTEIPISSPVHVIAQVPPSYIAGGDLRGHIHLISNSPGEAIRRLDLLQPQGPVIDIVSLGSDTLVAQYQRPPIVAWTRQLDDSWAPTRLPPFTLVEGVLSQGSDSSATAALRSGGILAMSKDQPNEPLSIRILCVHKSFVATYANNDGSFFAAEKGGTIAFFEDSQSEAPSRVWRSNDTSPVLQISNVDRNTCIIAKASGVIEMCGPSKISAEKPVEILRPSNGQFLGITKSGSVLLTEAQGLLLFEWSGGTFLPHQLLTGIRPVSFALLPGGALFLGGFRGEAEIWRRGEAGWDVRPLKPHQEMITTCMYTQATGLVTASYDKTIRTWAQL